MKEWNDFQNFPTISQLKGKKISKNNLNRQIKEGFLELWHLAVHVVSALKKPIKSKHNFESGHFQTFCYFI
jgi:hypothetical protein